MRQAAPEKIIVLKFGSSVLPTDADLPNAVHEIYRWAREGYRVIAVVSAIGQATDQLLARVRILSSMPEPFATAELLATGERSSAALLGLALDRAGLPARVLNPREIGLTVSGSPLDSELVSVDVERLRALLAEHTVLVVPGFFGTDAAGRTNLLGRGGSDLSAVFLAHSLGARGRLAKDVDGVYESDPSETHLASPRRFAELDYADALRVAGPLIQPKAVSYLQRHRSQAEVAALALPYQSVVHAGRTGLAAANSYPPLSVLLLGLGTVGFGVYQRLLANARYFSVLGILVRDRAKYEAHGIPAHLLHVEDDAIRTLRPDLVVDALPGIDPSRELVEHYLTLGADVVSANKVLIAEYAAPLTSLAERCGASLSYSAAVGGSTPMIEAVDAATVHGPIQSIAGVLNGTCNFVLDQCTAGEPLDQALAEARR